MRCFERFIRRLESAGSTDWSLLRPLVSITALCIGSPPAISWNEFKHTTKHLWIKFVHRSSLKSSESSSPLTCLTDNDLNQSRSTTKKKSKSSCQLSMLLSKSLASTSMWLSRAILTSIGTWCQRPGPDRLSTVFWFEVSWARSKD